MKTLRASNGETIRLDDDHAKYFLARHQKETPSQMRWVEVKEGKEIKVTIDWIMGLIEQFPNKDKLETQIDYIIEWIEGIGVGIDYEDK